MDNALKNISPINDRIRMSVKVTDENGQTSYSTKSYALPPFPYFLGKQGGVFKKIKNPNGDHVFMIYENTVFPTRRLIDDETKEESIELLVELPVDGKKLIRCPSADLLNKKKFSCFVASHGILLHPSSVSPFIEYIIDYVRFLQKKMPAEAEFSQFGWRDLDTKNARFVFSDKVFSADGKERESTLCSSLQHLKDSLAKKGDLGAWKKSFSVYENIENSMPFQFTLMLAFAAPLIALTPHNGLIYNMVGESGCGKSTALALMSSVWGKPTNKHLRAVDNDIPINNTLGALQSIPVTFDEMTTISSEKLVELSYNVTEGRGKNRASIGGETRVNNTKWKTLICGNSNISMYEKLGMARNGNNAHAYRIFEISATKSNPAYREIIDEASHTSEFNYGIAGRIYIKHVLENITKIEKELLKKINFLSKTLQTSERFWYTILGCVDVGSTISKALGLHNYDVENIIGFGIHQMGLARDATAISDGDSASILSDYLSSNVDKTIYTINGIYNNHNENNYQNGITVRMEIVDNIPSICYISTNSVRDFCKKNNINFSWLSKNLLSKNIITSSCAVVCLGRNTPYHTASVKAWEIDLKRHDLLLHDIV